MTAVSGRVFDASGAPAPGVFVYAVAEDGGRFGKAPGTHTDRDGQWSLELSPGMWTVRETGHDKHDVRVSDLPIALTLEGQVPAVTPGRDDVARLLTRRRELPEPALPTGLTDELERLTERRRDRPDPTKPDTPADVTRLLSRRRTAREES